MKLQECKKKISYRHFGKNNNLEMRDAIKLTLNLFNTLKLYLTPDVAFGSQCKQFRYKLS